jgi:hypothetical protein
MCANLRIEMDFGDSGRYSSPDVPWDLRQLKDIVKDWQTFMLANDGTTFPVRHIYLFPEL